MDGGPHLAVFTLVKIPLALLTVLEESKRLSRQGAEGIRWEAFFCALCNSECAFNTLGGWGVVLWIKYQVKEFRLRS